MDLQAGQNVPLRGAVISLRLACTPASQAASLDGCAFLIDATGKVQGDAGFVFYGQRIHPSQAVSFSDGGFLIDTARMPPGIERVVLAWSIDQGVAGLTAFAQFAGVTLTLTDAGAELCFAPSTANMREAALIMGEVYLRGGAWKFRAVGQGFAGGLAPLARQYGVDVSDPEQQAPPPRPAPPPAAPAAPARIDLRKREPVNLDKPAAGFGQITLNLNWNQGQVKRGLFGAKSGGIDLDLGCMVELANGDKAVVQALGNSFGSLERPPYAKLLGDDRTGASQAGETLLVNGKQWSQIKRLLVYAFIYEGVPNWASAHAVVRISAPGTPELVVSLDEHARDKGMCAIALLENVGGRIRVTKHVDYYRGHPEVDRAFGFGFRWVAGSK